MRTMRIVLAVAVAMAMTVIVSKPSASGLVGIYGVIERVVFEPSQAAPERVQVWGAFVYVNGGVGKDAGMSAIERGYLYFRLPEAALATPADVTLIRREWADLHTMAGSPDGVGFGRWGYIGRFADLGQATQETGPWFLERGVKSASYTDLRVRPATETPASPAAYQTNAGVVRLAAAGGHSLLVSRLRAKIAR